MFYPYISLGIVIKEKRENHTSFPDHLAFVISEEPFYIKNKKKNIDSTLIRNINVKVDT